MANITSSEKSSLEDLEDNYLDLLKTYSLCINEVNYAIYNTWWGKLVGLLVPLIIRSKIDERMCRISELFSFIVASKGIIDIEEVEAINSYVGNIDELRKQISKSNFIKHASLPVGIAGILAATQLSSFFNQVTGTSISSLITSGLELCFLQKLTFLVPIIVVILVILFFIYYIIGNRISNNYLDKSSIPEKEKDLSNSINHYVANLTRSHSKVNGKRLSAKSVGESMKESHGIDFDDYNIHDDYNIPADALEMNNKGKALCFQGMYDEAIHAFNRAIEIYPKFALAWFNKGNALKSLGNTTEAETAFAKAKEMGYRG
jgi:tetratricopeptide (TPR) repeat protein